MPARRVLMVGLDALDVGLLHRALDSGRLPNLKAWIEGAHELAVHSDGERLEGTVWPTFATGTGPGTHGHHWFYQWVAEEARFVPTSDARFAVTPFWAAALEAGLRVVAFDVPYMLPAGGAGERTYNGWGLQDEMAEHAHPPSFRREVLKRHGRSKVHKDTLLVHTPADRLKLARRLRAGARQRSGLLLDLVARRDWDLMLFGFGEYHLGGHHLATPMALSPRVTSEGAMYSIIKPVDDVWPGVVAAAGDDCDIVLFALHGMQPKVSYPETAQHIIRKMQGQDPPQPQKADLTRRIRNLLPQQVHQAIWLRLPATMRMQRMMDAWLSRMDLEHDRVFVFEGDCAVSLRVNLQGRERTGIVPPAEARTVLQAVFEESKRYATEDGEAPFVDIQFSADAYPGIRQALLPDATLVYNPKVHTTHHLTRDDGFEFTLFGQTSRTGTHTDRGFAFFRAGGPATLHRRDFANVDFAPTVLQRLGVTPPTHLEGVPFLE